MALKRGLTVDNAATELFGDVARVYDEVRDVALEYAMKHRGEVAGSKRLAETAHERYTRLYKDRKSVV